MKFAKCNNYLLSQIVNLEIYIICLSTSRLYLCDFVSECFGRVLFVILIVMLIDYGISFFLFTNF